MQRNERWLSRSRSPGERINCGSCARTVDAPILGDDGQTAHILVSCREVSGRRRLDESRARLAAIVESSEDAIIGKDLDGVVTAWNRGAENLFGYTAEEMIGQSIRCLLVPGQEAEEDEILGRVGRGETVQHSERQRRKKSGEVVEVSVTISPIGEGWPTTTPISNSKSSRLQGPKLGSSAFGGFNWPRGRRTLDPLTTTVDVRPLYPIGICSQFGSSGLDLSRNMVPTLVACSFDE